jgi:hypothetical protein
MPVHFSKGMVSNLTLGTPFPIKERVKSTSQRLKKALNNGGMEHKKIQEAKKDAGYGAPE